MVKIKPYLIHGRILYILTISYYPWQVLKPNPPILSQIKNTMFFISLNTKFKPITPEMWTVVIKLPAGSFLVKKKKKKNHTKVINPKPQNSLKEVIMTTY